MNASKVWVVTGASKGLGLHLVKSLLEKGQKVAATSRNIHALSELQTQYSHLLPISMEVSNPESVNDAIQKIHNFFGQIDVVINNAGYGLLGTLEELSDEEIQSIFQVNVFGVLHVCKAALPILRQQKSGHIINIASVSGSVSSPATGIYSATKASVLQISEALNAEVAEFRIKVTAVCPGGLRTDFLDQSSMKTPKNQINDYQVVRHTIQRLGQLNKNQGGDPLKAAESIIQLASLKTPPARIYLGSDALRMVNYKINEVIGSIQTHQALSESSDI